MISTGDQAKSGVICTPAALVTMEHVIRTFFGNNYVSAETISLKWTIMSVADAIESKGDPDIANTSVEKRLNEICNDPVFNHLYAYLNKRVEIWMDGDKSTQLGTICIYYEN